MDSERVGRLLASVVLGVTLVASPVAAVRAGAGDVEVPCDRLATFDRSSFGRPKIDNEFLPMVPGTRRVFEGDVDGVPHRVTFTVTDVTKYIDGVRSVVIWDVDESEGAVTESELAFFAQDAAGNVWNLGEYPEEYDDGVFVGAPNTWINGQMDAEGGVHMAGSPEITGPGDGPSLQGVAPSIDFLDCARVVTKGATVSVAAGEFDNVLVTNEFDPNVAADGVQVKYYAPGVGIVKIGFAVPGAAPETLELVSVSRLSKSEMARVRAAVITIDRRAYRVSSDYRATGKAK